MPEKINMKELEKQSFGFLMEEVERIISELETGTIDQLDQLIDNYEYGVNIISQCSRILKDAENKIIKITEQIQRESGQINA